jgi:hypothetical protein
MKTRISRYSLLVPALLGLAGCADLKTDLPDPVTPGVQVHGTDWTDTAAATFHGYVVRAAQGNVQSCLKCHGLDYQGGVSGVSCVACHKSEGATLHGRGWVTPGSPNFHGNTIRAANWDMRQCQTCHGGFYNGGKVNSSCRDCHTDTGGPEACATCHGSTNPAPPRDLSRNTAPTARGVGAHQIHLSGGAIAPGFACNECHVVPGPIYGGAHIDSTQGAELSFGSLSRRPSANGTLTPNPSYDSGALRCNNTFCHGNFTARKSEADPANRFAYTDTSASAVMSGANYGPLWTGGSSEATCRTCHRSIFVAPPAPPDTSAVPVGHIGPLALTTCGNSGCHPGIVNASGQIADRTRHMNGRINVRGTERSF